MFLKTDQKAHQKIHPTAIIDSKAELDSSVEVGAFTIIGASVKVGAGTRIGSHVALKGPTSIGKNTYLYAGIKLGFRIDNGGRVNFRLNFYG